MIAQFEDFCLWMYVVVDDIWERLKPLFRRPGPEPRCSDSELIAMNFGWLVPWTGSGDRAIVQFAVGSGPPTGRASVRCHRRSRHDDW